MVEGNGREVWGLSSGGSGGKGRGGGDMYLACCYKVLQQRKASSCPAAGQHCVVIFGAFHGSGISLGLAPIPSC